MAPPKSLKFYTADEQGHIKTVRCLQAGEKWEVKAQTIMPDVGSSAPVQRMSFLKRGEELIATARTDSSLSIFRSSSSEAGPSLTSLIETKETRMRGASHFVGLDLRENGIYSCTSSGHLRYTPLPPPNEASSSSAAAVGSLPQRLRGFKISPSGKTLAYGGDEVNVSVWDVERALGGPSKSDETGAAPASEGGKKRKKPDLFPGELWRARNEPNDTLDLRPPVQITALSYLSEQSIAAGTEEGVVRVYDTRRGKGRPVGYWKGWAKGSVKVIEPGENEHQVFVGDAAGTLASIDTRTGRCMYTYRALTSALTALASIPASSASATGAGETGLLASVGRDRLFRLSSAPPPQEDPKKNQERRGEVLVVEYLPSVPSAVCFAGWEEAPSPAGDGEVGGGKEGDEGDGEESEEEGDVGEEVWEGMEEVGSSDEEEEAGAQKDRKRARR